MIGFGPDRSNSCADIGLPHSGHAFSVGDSGGVDSYGPTDAGPAYLIRPLLTHA